jgi:hypothetical protein
MRATYAVILVGSFLIASLLVPFDYKQRPTSAAHVHPEAASVAAPPTQFVLPHGLNEMPFPDGWEGERSKTLFDQQMTLPGTSGLNDQWVKVPIPGGERVLPGTRWVNVSVETTAASTQDYTILADHRTADDRHYARNLDKAGAYSVVVEEEMNDWSPDQDTRWVFGLAQTGVTTMTVKVHIEIARTADPLPIVVLFKDPWKGAERAKLYDQSDRLRQAQVWKAGVPLPDDHAAGTTPLRGVPTLDVARIVIDLWYNSSTPSDMHFRPVLSWRSPHGAALGGYEHANVAPDGQERGSVGGHFVWSIPVEPDMWDSLFAAHTRWAIDVNWYGDGQSVSDSYMDGNYHLEMVAQRTA